MSETTGDESSKKKEFILDVNFKQPVKTNIRNGIIEHAYETSLRGHESEAWPFFSAVGAVSPSMMFFKTDLAKIPCFKSTFLNAIGGGAAGYIATLFLTSDPTRSLRYGYNTFLLVACGSWIFCRYHYNKQLIETNKINKAIAERSKQTILQIDNVDGENVAQKS